MKKFVLVSVLVAVATSATAGNLEEPLVEPQIEEPVIIEDATTGSSSGIWIPLVLLALVAATVSAD